MKSNVVAMLLVGGKGTRLHPITKHMAKPAVPFGGKYRLIDFVLSNLTNSFINTIGVVTQYEPHSLMHYIEHGAAWDLDVTPGGIQFLTPFTSYEGEKWQKGTAHAVRQHMHFLKRHDSEYVLILSGDHVYKMDYNALIEDHKSSNADITISAFKPHDDLSRYGVFSMDETRKIMEFEEKPTAPKGDFASMGIYVFNRAVLSKLLSVDMPEGFDFGKDIIPKALSEQYHLNGYIFEGYFRDVGTIETLFEANMDLIDHPEYLKLNDYKTLPIYTRSSDFPPHHIALKEPVKKSLISDGCLIQGSIHHSVISESVVVRESASVEYCVLHSNVTVNDNCKLKNVIALEGTVIPPNTNIVYDQVNVIDNDILWALGDGSFE